MPTFCDPWPGNTNASFPISPSSPNDRQHDVRRPFGVVEDRLAGGAEVVGTVGAEGLAAVGVAVEAGEAAAGHDHPQAVAGVEDVARAPQVLVEGPRAAGPPDALPRRPAPEARPPDA